MSIAIHARPVETHPHRSSSRHQRLPRHRPDRHRSQIAQEIVLPPLHRAQRSHRRGNYPRFLDTRCLWPKIPDKTFESGRSQRLCYKVWQLPVVTVVLSLHFYAVPKSGTPPVSGLIHPCRHFRPPPGGPPGVPYSHSTRRCPALSTRPLACLFDCHDLPSPNSLGGPELRNPVPRLPWEVLRALSGRAPTSLI